MKCEVETVKENPNSFHTYISVNFNFSTSKAESQNTVGMDGIWTELQYFFGEFISFPA